MGHTSPLEARFCAQVAHAVEGMTRAEGDAIVQQLVARYRDVLPSADIGKHFRETYNLDTLEPTPEWQATNQAVLSELSELGLSL